MGVSIQNQSLYHLTIYFNSLQVSKWLRSRLMEPITKTSATTHTSIIMQQKNIQIYASKLYFSLTNTIHKAHHVRICYYQSNHN